MFMTVLGVIWTAEDYASSPIVTSVTVKNQHKLEFPAVTLCNLNKLHCGNLYLRILNCSEDVSESIKSMILIVVSNTFLLHLYLIIISSITIFRLQIALRG